MAEDGAEIALEIGEPGAPSDQGELAVQDAQDAQAEQEPVIEQMESPMREFVGVSLEEEVAQRDALALAARPDPAPIVTILPLVGAGMLQPGAGFESTLYMPVERQEMVSADNLAITFARAAEDAEGPAVVTDVVVVEDEAAPEGYVLSPDLMPTGSAAHVFLAVRTEAASHEPPLVFTLTSPLHYPLLAPT